MFNNYFYLLRSVYELNNILKNSTILEIYSQTKNVLYLRIPSDSYPNRHLLISTNPQSPYLHLKNQHHKAKKNVANFFEGNVPCKINNLEMAAFDRCIKFNTDSGQLFFVIRGNNTNIHLLNKKREEQKFKKTDLSIIDIIKNQSFGEGSGFNFDEYSHPDQDDIVNLKKQFPMISSEIKNEILHRKSTTPSQNLFDIFKHVVNDILNNNILVGYNKYISKVVFAPDSFLTSASVEEPESFKDYNSAIQYYIVIKQKNVVTDNISKELENYFEKELSRLANKINKLNGRIDSGSKESTYYSVGNLLLSNIYKLKKGIDQVILHDYQTNSDITIKLSPKLSPKENIEKYFEKAKDEKINYNKSLELLNFTLNKYNYLKDELYNYEMADSLDEITKIHKRILPKKENIIKMETGLKFKYWHYVVEDKYNIYIGRDSKSNDYLSIKFANQNDYWFHARGMPGSHVVLKVENVKEGIPKHIIKAAANLAAYYSKAKTAGTVPVSYTFAKFVYKKKGMLPGKVMLTKEKTLMVKPEIPKSSQLMDN